MHGDREWTLIELLQKIQNWLREIKHKLLFLAYSLPIDIRGWWCLTLVTPWTVAHQAPLPMEFSRQKYWSGLPVPSLGI